MKKSRRVVVVALALAVAGGAAAWWFGRPNFETLPLAQLDPCESRSGQVPVALWPERGLDLRIDLLTDRSNGASWSTDGVPRPKREQLFYWNDLGSDRRRVGMVLSYGKIQRDKVWQLGVELEGMPFAGSAVFRRFSDREIIVPSELDSVDVLLLMFDKEVGKRVAYFPFFGGGEHNGVTYNGPGIAERIMSFDRDSSTKWVSFNFDSAYDGYAVWFVPQFSGGWRAPENNSAERAILISDGARQRILSTQFGDKRVVGWHVYATPSYRFTLKGVPLRPDEQ